MTPQECDDALVEYVARYGGEWVSAASASRAVPGMSAIAAGRRLTRLGREGRVEVKFEVYMNYYRVQPKV